MPAGSLNCPMCGAAASSEATQCEHCGARLATVACPSCFGMIFRGSKFCSHCGAAVERVEDGTERPRKCPRCRIQMKGVTLGNSSLLECPKCDGLWADKESLERICADRERQAAVLGTPGPATGTGDRELEKVSYLPCPICSSLMNRVNFARCSHVIVDVCNKHGTWFDRDELRRIVEFIRGGGLDVAREREIRELEERRRALESARQSAALDAARYGGLQYGERYTGISAAAEVLRSLFG